MLFEGQEKDRASFDYKKRAPNSGRQITRLYCISCNIKLGLSLDHIDQMDSKINRSMEQNYE